MGTLTVAALQLALGSEDEGANIAAVSALVEDAAKRGARIVTNDRYRDWAEGHPEIAHPGHLIRGSFRGGSLRLDLE